MSTAFAEVPQFDQEADYRQTLAAIELEFLANKARLFDNGNGQLILAGTADARSDLLPHDNTYDAARTVRLTLAHFPAREGECAYYSYDVLAIDGKGEQVGERIGGIYRTQPAARDWSGRDLATGVRHRNLLDAVQYDSLLSNMMAQNYLGGGALGAGVEAAYQGEERMRTSMHFRRIKNVLGWLGMRGRKPPEQNDQAS